MKTKEEIEAKIEGESEEEREVRLDVEGLLLKRRIKNRIPTLIWLRGEKQKKLDNVTQSKNRTAFEIYVINKMIIREDTPKMEAEK